MRYLVIESESNQWVYDGDSKREAEREYGLRAMTDVPCVMVRVMSDTADTEADVPDVFGDAESVPCTA